MSTCQLCWGLTLQYTGSTSRRSVALISYLLAPMKLRLKRTPGADTDQPENVQNVQIFPFADCMAVPSIFMHQKYFLCFETELLKVQPCWFTLHQWRAEKKAGSWHNRHLCNTTNLVHNAKNTDWEKQNGSTQSYVTLRSIHAGLIVINEQQ